MSTPTEYRTLPSGLDLIRISDHLDGDEVDIYLLGGSKITKREFDALYPLANPKKNQTKFICRECIDPCILVVPEIWPNRIPSNLPTACPYKGGVPKWKEEASE